ncbi:host-nuclease inhibitor Gam family protein [Erythrobacter sp. WG]|uniref:host-nuclease inhibitor Gam family protein n=1 Tax=Erythrobacter sp. WG TaxID=2985510 RepID=UPI00226F781E|nr:host-nuclease inhibitor Gam family protein [Erythrobacter sp. WG]MCX9146631.1 host-nuclease inhibitor Gam family protein [Erythrobacter sp. WG]
MPRRKSVAAPAPTSTAEAALMAAEYVQIEREKALERLAAAAEIDRIAGQRDQRLAELEAEAKPLFAGLKAWWEANGKEELAKGRRSAELAGAKIGIRLTPPAVKLKRGVKIGDVVAFLQGLRWHRAKDFLRTKVDLDRQAVIKAVFADADAEAGATFARVLSVEQTDEFFIDTGLDEDELKKEIAAS